MNESVLFGDFVPSVGSACVWGWIVPTAHYESDQLLENKDCKFVGWTKRPTVYNKVCKQRL